MSHHSLHDVESNEIMYEYLIHEMALLWELAEIDAQNEAQGCSE